MICTPNHHLQNNRASGNRGFTMTELAIVLGIVGVVLGAIWVASATLYQRYRVNKAVFQITSIVNNMRALYKDRPAFDSGVLTTDLVALNVFPSDMIANGLPQNPWGATCDSMFGSALCDPVMRTVGAGVDVAVMPFVGSGYGGGGVAGLWPNPNVLEIGYWGLPREASIGILSRFTGANASDDVVFAYCDGAGVLFLTPATVTPAQLVNCIGNTVLYFRK